MRQPVLPIVLFLLFLSCKTETSKDNLVKEETTEIEVVRFDKIFFETPVKDLNKIKKEFPYFFPTNAPDSVWINKMQSPIWREVYTEVQKKYSDFSPIKEDFEKLFGKIKSYYPQSRKPKLITIISEMDYNTKAIYTDSLVIVSIELYLGEGHRFYQFPKYLKRNFKQSQIMPDIVSSFATTKIPTLSSSQSTLLAQMIYYGKQLYLKDVLLPDCEDWDRIGYTKEQIGWCEENENYIWRFFVEHEMLYSKDKRLATRFIERAPFSKFYLNIDQYSPGQVGMWLGWQIVRSYMENNNVPLDNMLKADTKEIFEKSRYKPKK